MSGIRRKDHSEMVLCAVTQLGSLFGLHCFNLENGRVGLNNSSTGACFLPGAMPDPGETVTKETPYLQTTYNLPEADKSTRKFFILAQREHTEAQIRSGCGNV